LTISIHTDDFNTLVESSKKAGYRFVAPVDESGIRLFKPIDRADRMYLTEIQPRKSPKEYFLAETEIILNYKRKGKHGVDISESSDEKIAPRTVIFGCRPCDAAGPDIIRAVMTWDYDDQFFLERKRKTVVISIACIEADEACYCTSVKLAPDSDVGADILLIPSNEKTGAKQEYLVKVVTEKGQEFIGKTSGWREGNPIPSKALDEVKKYLEPAFDFDRVKKWLDSNFDHDFWKTATLACIACGTCTYVCPTCHCFDIVDEGSVDGGCRYKNWDSCMMQQFTLHASGHNPRPLKTNRFRQRIMHKFRYYNDMFDRILCSGCGRCQRHCPTDIALKGLLNGIDRIAREESETAGASKK